MEPQAQLPSDVAMLMGSVVKNTISTYSPGEGPNLKQVYMMEINRAMREAPSMITGQLFYYFRQDCVEALNYINQPPT